MGGTEDYNFSSELTPRHIFREGPTARAAISTQDLEWWRMDTLDDKGWDTKSSTVDMNPAIEEPTDLHVFHLKTMG